MLNQYQILDKTINTGLHPPHQRVHYLKELAYKRLWPILIFYYANMTIVNHLSTLTQNTAFHSHRYSKSHCHNRNLYVFFVQKQYLNHRYSQYNDAFIEGGNIAEECIIVW